MSLSTLIWGQSQFDEAVEKATSELRLADEDIALNLEICDQIRSKSVPAKDATRALKRRLNHKNPNVQLLALTLTDVCVKNGGDHFLNEVASKEFMDNLVSILKMPALNLDVKNRILHLIQNWSVAFEGKYTLGYVNQVYKGLKLEGYSFPPKDLTVANSAMVDTSTAPDWIDSDICLRCRDDFTFTNRKHHCRNCGGVFDQKCSSKSMPLPHFGITQEVRVCEGCFTKLNGKVSRDRERSHSLDTTSHHRHSSSRKHRSARDFSDADLQRAIQLSLTESSGTSHSNRPSYDEWQSSEPPIVDHATRPGVYGNKQEEEEEDPELRAAIEASLREANAPKPSAPVAAPYDGRDEYVFSSPSTYMSGDTQYAFAAQPPLPKLPNHDLHPRESDAIMTFSQTVQDARAQGSPDLSRISNVHELYDRANGVRPKLALSLDDTGRKEQMLSEMHEKLSHAVKLYDHLLTEQISRPTWRAASTSQQTYSYSPSRYATIGGQIGEWSKHQTMSPPLEHDHRNMGYATTTTPSIHVRHPLPPEQQSINQYVQPPMNQPQGSQLPAAAPQPTASAQEHRSQEEQYQSFHGAALQTHPNQPQQSPAYSQEAASSTSFVPSAIQPPTPLPQLQYAPMTAQPVQLPPPPPQQQQQQSHQVIPPPLSRHNTLNHSQSHSFPPSSSNLGRSNTVASHSQPRQTFMSPSAVPNTLPSFPTAPTSNPLSFPMYSPPSTGFEQVEKKEVPLIDL
ncbi:hypothetical protein BU17DRAFT_41967 [Hysterangium stoloniferum]|nr:hypothetical protein BU17DRAFT_41967 [Hysterangium stoloniferum]